jgi:hypothetical protein
MLDLLTKEYTWLESVNPHRKIGFQLSEEVDSLIEREGLEAPALWNFLQ